MSVASDKLPMLQWMGCPTPMSKRPALSVLFQKKNGREERRKLKWEENVCWRRSVGSWRRKMGTRYDHISLYVCMKFSKNTF